MAGHPIILDKPYPGLLQGKTVKPVTIDKNTNGVSYAVEEVREVYFSINNFNLHLCRSCTREIKAGELIGRDLFKDTVLYCRDCVTPDEVIAASMDDLYILEIQHQGKRKTKRNKSGIEKVKGIFTGKSFFDYVQSLKESGYTKISVSMFSGDGFKAFADVMLDNQDQGKEKG